jgi:hypothetical protein
MAQPTGDRFESEPELVVARPTSARRRLVLEAIVAAWLVLCVYVVLRPDPVRSLGTMYDDVVYVSLAKAIATGQGYHSIHLVGASVHEKFPPGVPMVYALAWRITGSLEGTLWLGLWLTIGAVALGVRLPFWYSRYSSLLPAGERAVVSAHLGRRRSSSPTRSLIASRSRFRTNS